jgi:hypothetical protein
MLKEYIAADDHCLTRLDSRALAAAPRSNTINRFFIKNGNEMRRPT